MNIIERANDLAAQHKVSEAFQLLSSAIAQGNAAAAFHLAEWRMAGDYIRRDICDARKLFGISADLGLTQAEEPYLALLGNGAGNIERRWSEALSRLQLQSEVSGRARAQLELLEMMQLDDAGNPLRSIASEQISTTPDIKRAPSFLTSVECKYISALADPLLQPSVIVNPDTGELISNPLRSSTSAAFPFILEDPVIHAINRRISTLTDTEYSQGEPLQVLSYKIGQEYKMHSDALPVGANQRLATLLVYLNDGYEGGETFFPEIGKSFRGEPGDAIYFINVDDHGRADPAAVHAGLPVRNGRKLILSKWIRARPLDLTGPPGRPY